MAPSLTTRITLTGPPEQDPEDILSACLGVIYPDDVTNQHGDAEHGLLYTSPHLPRPLAISLADPEKDEERRLFSHYLWNSSLLLAEFIEAGCLGVDVDEAGLHPPLRMFDVRGQKTVELGAGTALPSLMAALLGAEEVVVTDYPAPEVLGNLKSVVAANAVPENSPLGAVAPVQALGHAWGELGTEFALANRGKYDRVLVCDCLWMPWQHGNLLRSISWFLKDGDEGRVWLVAGFHTGRKMVADFFDQNTLREDGGLEVECIFERDCDGVEREWVPDRGWEDPSVRKRWLVVAVLRRVRETE